jgi:hypothetical protein
LQSHGQYQNQALHFAFVITTLTNGSIAYMVFTMFASKVYLFAILLALATLSSMTLRRHYCDADL